MMMSTVPHDILLGRWRLTLDLFGRVFVDDVGLEPGSIISELGGFPVKEAKFRREMEKLRNSRTVDLTLSKLDRDRNNLIVQSFKEFNTHYAQNQRRSSSQPPMVVNRIKVSIVFKFPVEKSNEITIHNNGVIFVVVIFQVSYVLLI